MSKLKATVLFDYDAEASDELTLRIGDVLTNIAQIEEGWCQGTLNGKNGMFPDNFVKIEEDKSFVKPTAAKSPAAMPPAKAKKEAKRLMKVTFSYDPVNEDELKLEVGQIVEILQDEEEGWAQGRLNGKEGVFPTNFCVPFESDSPVKGATEEQQKPEENKIHTNTKKPTVKGVGFGNIFNDGPISLKKASVEDPVSNKLSTKKEQDKKVQVVVKEKEKKPPSMKASKPVERCRATFDYQATTDDELSLAKGDIVTILNKNCVDAGWWEGEIEDNNGRKRRGMFPDNFVELLPSDDKLNEKPSAKESFDDTKDKNLDSESGKTSPGPATNTSSLKRPAPQVPPATNKPTLHEDNIDDPVSDVSAMMPPSEEQNLTHYKRASGPKNRRKPDSAGRRERAKEASEDIAANAVTDTLDSEPQPEPEPSPPPANPKRGIPVIPMPTGVNESGDTPLWLKNLKSRTSVKRESGSLALSPNKPEESNTNGVPDWKASLRKNQAKSGDKSVSPAAPKPSSATPAKPNVTANSHTPVKPPSLDGSAAEAKKEETWSFKKNMKSKSENDVLATAAAETPADTKPETPSTYEGKRPPLKPPVALHPPKPSEPPKKPPPASAKPRPPPTKTKPVIPGGKPTIAANLSGSTSSADEEVKALKEQFLHYQSETRKEISNLRKELEEEKKQRLAMQAEIAQLRKQIR